MRLRAAATAGALAVALLASPAHAEDVGTGEASAGTPAPPPVEPAPEPSITAATEPASDEPAPEQPATSQIAWSATSYAGLLATTISVGGALSGADSATVRIARLHDGAWSPLPVTVTRSGDSFAAQLPVDVQTTTVRAEFVDAGAVVAISEAATVTGAKATSTLSLSLPSKVVDYRTVGLVASWQTQDGRRPTGPVDLVFKKRGSKSYVRYRSLSLVDGVVRTKVTPRQDGWFALRFAGSESLSPASSARRYIDNRPPGKAVVIPKRASKPSIRLPAQRRATRVHADARVSKISHAVWRSMKGRSWHRGCPVGRSSLRVVRVSYWAFDGYVRRGEIVVGKSHAKATARVFTTLFNRRTPIRSMYRVDRFGWSKTLRGANDYRSMRADNTSGFNCRGVVGAPHRRSPHSYGKAIDINPWENPYASPKGWTPNGSWQKRSSPSSVTWRGRNDPVVRAFGKNGFRWLGGFDLQHFER